MSYVEEEYQFYDVAKFSESILVHYGQDEEIIKEFCKDRYEIGMHCMIITKGEVLKDLKID